MRLVQLRKAVEPISNLKIIVGCTDIGATRIVRESKDNYIKSYQQYN